ncbi:uncharacterized protein LOC144219909 [Crocuta crocuta]
MHCGRPPEKGKVCPGAGHSLRKGQEAGKGRKQNGEPAFGETPGNCSPGKAGSGDPRLSARRRAGAGLCNPSSRCVRESNTRPLPPTWGSSLAPSARPTPTSSEAHSAAHRHCEHLVDAVPGLWVRGLMGTTAQFLA